MTDHLGLWLALYLLWFLLGGWFVVLPVVAAAYGVFRYVRARGGPFS